MFKRLLLLAFAAVISLAGAHAHLADGPETVEPGETITLTFTEPIELLFSEFRVFAINADDAEQLSDADFVAFLDRAEEESIAGLTVTEDEEFAYVFHLTFEEPLAAGTYVVVWNVLSIDTHSSSEHHVFTVAE